ncbi:MULTISPECIES: DUF3108 domain-containing protein [Methylobacterium]|uniref:DUF3108 domain-containing protein n=2 Tax=Pseudomonadota TaxID=1224 RepID=A0ABQ4SPA7_9HYPH|nr:MULTISPECIES: DUF3108 domain-containing protein [Methylobacterium]PIU08313.1 MAG: DUF3108 domain-containing protein [Methylobacterium sp. CG09_land_8_20_14_0_10_71_15]PIU11597.1 MAG: DUF3108 domain-containing protein [Methylobacterium sp. CG08_land_8_20_14_0_20_71_15]GBU19537.1 hypothetical protein AwMethylo_37520 [Methylobacterium sp.]GJE05054.1 hypothetical protein AOPFMNJM_0349 [Methylobacterium jeotgali]
MRATSDLRALRQPAVARLAQVAVLAGAVVAAGAAEAGPKGRKGTAPAGVAVDYGIALAGMSIGTARLDGAFEGARYRMDVSATLTGLVGAITGGQGSARASGTLAAAPQPNAFSIATRTANSGIAVRMALARGNVVQSEVTPPLLDTGDRVPVTAAEKRGVMDPASALLMPAAARGDLTDPENCNRTLPVFDGATRFNVVLSYGETRAVEKPGYSGPVLVCNARYQAIAGHRPDRPGVKFMEENRDMSVWLAPVEGTRLLVPMRISVRTTLGTNIIEATRWTRTGTASAAAPGTVASLGEP